MKQVLLIALLIFTLVGCKKEEITPSTPTITGSSWNMIQTIPGSSPSQQVVTLNADHTVTGGTWSLNGSAFTMTKWNTTYSGVLSGSLIEGTTQAPVGTFRMTKR